MLFYSKQWLHIASDLKYKHLKMKNIAFGGSKQQFKILILFKK
jgi:hypothetical protein